MSDEKMGGPAFPTMYGAERANDDNTLFNVTNGMTLWDYYAAAAMTGYLAAGNRVDDSMAHEAATAADLMLAERAKRAENYGDIERD